MSAIQQALLLRSGVRPLGTADPATFSNVKMLVHFDGVNNSSIATNVIGGGTFGTQGNVLIKTAFSKFGGASGLIPTTGSTAWTRADGAIDGALGSRNFFLEGWVYYDTTVNAADGVFFSRMQYDPNNIRRSYSFGKKGTGELWFSYATAGSIATTVDITTTWSPAANTWYNVAVGRSGNTLYMFIDGVLQTTASMSGITIFNTDVGYCIGASINGFSGLYFQQSNAYQDEWRLTMDQCLATSTYAVQTSAWPDS